MRPGGTLTLAPQTVYPAIALTLTVLRTSRRPNHITKPKPVPNPNPESNPNLNHNPVPHPEPTLNPNSDPDLDPSAMPLRDKNDGGVDLNALRNIQVRTPTDSHIWPHPLVSQTLAISMN